MAETKTLEQKVDNLLTLVIELVRAQAEFALTQEEILEKLANLNASGSGWGIEEYDTQT